MAENKMKPKEERPPVDKQAHTDIAVHEGKEGEQAHAINEEEADKRKAASKRQESSG